MKMRRAAAPLACALAAALLAPASALAESPKWFSAEIGAGAVRLEGDIPQEVYGEREQPALHGRAGVLLFSVVDLGVGADFSQMSARRLGADKGDASGEITRLTLVPITATGALRLDFFPEQPLVPYAGAGVSYLVFSERNPIEDDQVDGDKYGWTAFAGLQILLDWLEPARASDLDGWWGVNDTYLSLEVSKTVYDRLGQGPAEGLDLDHLEGRASFLFEF